jgi:transposase
MNINWDTVKIYLRPGGTDMRKQINTLSEFVAREMKRNPLNGNLYVFCGKNRSRLKVLYWERNGFCMWQKRLEKDRFPWPRTEEEALEISKEEMFMLLKGIDFFKEHKSITFTAVS